MSFRQKAAKGILWSVIQKWGREAISFLILMVLTRLLAPEAFGLVALAAIFTDFLETFLDQGLSAAIVQRADLEPEHLDTMLETLMKFDNNTRSSLYYDLTNGKPMEIEALSGTVVRQGERLGVPTPIHRTIYAALLPYHRKHSQQLLINRKP